MAYISRRGVLRGVSAIGMTSATGLLSQMGQAHASGSTGYKALVCLFLRGGLDSLDTVIPYDTESHSELAGLREDLFDRYDVGSGNSSRDRQNMLPLQTERDFGGRQFAFPRGMSGMHRLYEQKKLAIVGNVGPLIMPTERTDMVNETADIPQRLFSHNDQQSMWMSLGLEGQRIGWGGAFADAVAPSSGRGLTFASVSAAGARPFLNAGRTRQYPASLTGPVSLEVAKSTRLGSSADTARRLLLEHYASTGRQSENVLIRDMIAANSKTMGDNASFKTAIENSHMFNAAFPDTPVGRQLATIAATISVQAVLGVDRQVFYAEAKGFDTHNDQAEDLPRLQQQVSDAVAAFSDAMDEIGQGDQVTLFTGSDFGRTSTGNGDGTDHGWGGHNFVVGGAVEGGEIYGDIPALDLGLESYTVSGGRMIPTTSVDQYAASLGRWFGIGESDLRDALPNLGNFTTMPNIFGA